MISFRYEDITVYEVNRIKQRLLIKGFPQVSHGIHFRRPFLPLRGIVGSHENHRMKGSGRGKFFIKIQARHAWEANVQKDTAFCTHRVGEKEVLSGPKGHYVLPMSAEQSLQGLP